VEALGVGDVVADGPVSTFVVAADGLVSTGVVAADGLVSTGVVAADGLVSTGVVAADGLVSTGVFGADGLVSTRVVATDGLVSTGAVVVVARSVGAGGEDVLCEPNASGCSPLGIAAAAAVLRSGAGGSAAATGTRANAQTRAGAALQRCLVPLPQPRRSDGTQMLTLSPPSFAVCRSKGKCRDAFVNPSPWTE
jgi:hypothetical protein